jgi:hypothetical protein
MAFAVRASAASQCADTLPIDASQADEALLRAELAGGRLSVTDSERCEGARVILGRTSEGWHLTLETNERRTLVERDVKTMHHAAVWLESWLEVDPDASPARAEVATPIPTDVESSVTRDTPVSAELVSGARWQAPLGVRAIAIGATSGAKPWLGAEITPQWFAHGTFWLGPDFVLARQARDTAGVRRDLLAGSAAAGFRWPIYRRLRLSPTLSTGLAYVNTERSGATSTVTRRSFVPDLSAALDLELFVSNRVALSIGVGARTLLPAFTASTSNTPSAAQVRTERDDDDRNPENDVGAAPVALAPASVPRAMASLRLGFALAFGREP